MWAVIKKEFKSYFKTPIGYIFIGVFLIAFSISFYFSVIGYGNVNYEYIFYSLPTILVLAFIIPMLTMRSFAEERKSGTEQLLLTSPLSITKITLGKFIAASLIALITEACTLLYFGILCFFGMPHISTAIATLFGFLLFLMAYISFGMLASSITENQVISAIVTVAFLVLTLFIENISSSLSSLSIMSFYEKFPVGVISLKEIAGLVSFSIVFIALTILVMQRRKSVK